MTQSIFIPAAFILLATPLTANAQTPDILNKLYACKTITDAAARLECYDLNTGAVESAQETGELITIDKAEARKIRKESFGFNIPSLPQLGLFKRSETSKNSDVSKNKDFEAISANIKSAKKSATGRHTFTLDNGQVWAQTQSARVPTIRKKRTYTMKIRRAAMGSYIGIINDTGAGIRLKRIE